MLFLLLLLLLLLGAAWKVEARLLNTHSLGPLFFSFHGAAFLRRRRSLVLRLHAKARGGGGGGGCLKPGRRCCSVDGGIPSPSPFSLSLSPDGTDIAFRLWLLAARRLLKIQKSPSHLRKEERERGRTGLVVCNFPFSPENRHTPPAIPPSMQIAEM